MLELEGAAGVLANLDRLIELTEDPETLKQVFLPAAERARDIAKAIVHRHTGELAEHIFATPGEEDLPNVIMGVDVTQVPYAHIVEFGGPHHTAHPYLRPAADEIEGQLDQLAADTLVKLIEARLR